MLFASLLLWYLYDDHMAYLMFIFMQTSLMFSDTKLVPVSDIIFLGSPYSVKLILQHEIGLFADHFTVYCTIGDLLLLTVIKSVPIISHGLHEIL